MNPSLQKTVPTKRWRKFVFLITLSVLVVAAILLAIRFLAAPFSPVNVAAAAGVSFLLLILLQPSSAGSGVPRSLGGCPTGIVVTMFAAFTALAFLPNLRTPFVCDAYGHVLEASHTTWRILGDAFAPVHGSHDSFFRPVGFISYWLDYQWAGVSPIRWHLWNLGVHVVNTCLVYLLVMRLGISRVPAAIAALVFGLDGSRAEAVSWTDTRFDLLACFFALCSLLFVLKFCRDGRRWWLAPVLGCAALAVYTKESAFCLPLLPLALLPLLPRPQWRRAIAASVALGLVCAILFAYRWWALGGLGGYEDPSGVSIYWRSRPLHTSEAMLFRQWAFLFFPINWLAPLEWWLRVAGVSFLAMLVLFGVCERQATQNDGLSRPDFVGQLLAGPAFVLAAAIPVEHLLGFQFDFAGARVLYLPVIGFAIFWAVLVDRSAHRRLAYATAAVLILFNLAALEHNLRPWRTTPETAAAVCRGLGSELAKDPRPVFVTGLPDRLDGVYFLFNGFPECVEMNSGQNAARVYAPRGPAVPAGARRFVWSREARRLEEIP